MTDNQNLLAEYVQTGSDAAFRELVTRYVDLVYSTALRLLGGDTHRAEDVAQTVFVNLARVAQTLPKDVKLGGWLHRDTCFTASTLMRGERRRQSRERQAAEMNERQNNSEAGYSLVAPVLDEAINELDEADRTAILLRFFEQHDFRSVGQALGSNENAARMRVTRALDKLEVLLKHRGVTTTAMSLSVVLSANAIQASPVGLAVTISTAALAGTTLATAATATATKAIAMTTLQKAIVTTTVAVLAGAGIFEARQVSQLRDQVQTLQQQQAPLAEQIQHLERERDDAVQRIAALQNENQRLSNNTTELLKLRGEVGMLRRQAAKTAKAPAPVATPSQETGTTFTPEEELKQAAIAKMNYAKEWVLAFHLYAAQNPGQFPTNFDQAASLLRDEAKLEANLKEHEFLPNTPKYGLTPDHYEIMYQGAIPELTNGQEIIVIREKEPWQTPDGSWHRAYGFADGHSEIHKAADGNFETWEAKHMIRRPDPNQ
jgi:RNA polymerase sigma factor (sigma-70 family)